MDPYHRNSHMEDYDSDRGDVEAGSLAASAAHSRHHNDLYAGIRRGQLNARASERASTRLTPDQLMARMHGHNDDDDDDGFSVNTGRIDGMEQTVVDDRTFDGSTIATNTHQLDHYNNRPNPSNINLEFQNYGRKASSETDNTRSSEGSPNRRKNNNKSNRRKKSVCCGVSKCCLVLMLLFLLALIAAFVLWVFLGYLPSQQADNGNSPSSSTATSTLPCCAGYNTANWSGETVCSEGNGEDKCCRVCPASGGADGNGEAATTKKPEVKATPAPTNPPATNAPVTRPPVTDAPAATDPPKTDVPATDPPTTTPTVVVEKTPEPTGAPTPGPTVAETPAPTMAPTAAATVAATPGPTIADTTPLVLIDETLELGDANASTTEQAAPSDQEDYPCCSDEDDLDFFGRVRCTQAGFVVGCCTVCER